MLIVEAMNQVMNNKKRAFRGTQTWWIEKLDDFGGVVRVVKYNCQSCKGSLEIGLPFMATPDDILADWRIEP